MAAEQYPYPMSLMMEYCIAGHHSGLPDGGNANDTPDMSTLHGRMVRKFEDFKVYKEEFELPSVDFQKWAAFMIGDCQGNTDRLIDKFAFLTVL